MLVSVCRGRRPGSQIKFIENITQVSRHGFLADAQRLGNFSVGHTGRHEFQNFDFPGSKRTCRLTLALVNEHLQSCEIRGRTKCFEHLARRRQLQFRGIAIPHFPAGQRDEHAHASRFVRRVNFSKQLQCLRNTDSAVCASFSANKTAPLARPATAYSTGASNFLAIFAQLIGGCARARHVFGSQTNFYIGIQYSGSRAGIFYFIGDMPNGLVRGVNLSLHEPQLRESWPRSFLPLACLAVGFLSRCEFSTQAMNLAELV